MKLLLLPVVVSISYEFNRFVGRHDNAVTRALSYPGMALQNFTTNEPDDSMIEVGHPRRWSWYCRNGRAMTDGRAPL